MGTHSITQHVEHLLSLLEAEMFTHCLQGEITYRHNVLVETIPEKCGHFNVFQPQALLVCEAW